MERSDGGDVARAQAGDTEAFGRLVALHSRAVFRLAYRMTGNEQDAEDVVQETFLKAYRRLEQFEQRANFGSWLHRIGANCAYDLLRGRGRAAGRVEPVDTERGDPLEAVPDSEPGQERLVFGREVRTRVRAAMTRMSDTERSAFVLRHFEGFTTEEIGAALGIDRSAVKQGVFRAVRKLRQVLEPVARPEVAPIGEVPS